MRIQTRAFTAKVGSFLMGLSWWSRILCLEINVVFLLVETSLGNTTLFTPKKRKKILRLQCCRWFHFLCWHLSFNLYWRHFFRKNCLKRFLLPGENFLAFIYSSANSRVGNWCCRRKCWSLPISYLYYGAHLLRPIIGLVFWFAFP